jgi:REP element-mobilizing transposase RayT
MILSITARLFSRAVFNYLKGRSHLVKGYVVMPNHIHALIYFSKTDRPINKIVGDGKRFMAYRIDTRLKENGKEDILGQLQEAIEAKDKQRGKKHEVREDSFFKDLPYLKGHEPEIGIHAC